MFAMKISDNRGTEEQAFHSLPSNQSLSQHLRFFHNASTKWKQWFKYIAVN